MWRQLQQKDPAAFPQRADKGMSTLESLTQTFPLTDPKVTQLPTGGAYKYLIYPAITWYTSL